MIFFLRVLLTKTTMRNRSRPTRLSGTCLAMSRHHTAFRLFVLLFCLTFIQYGTANDDNSGWRISHKLSGLEAAAEAALESRTQSANKYAKLVDELHELVEESMKLDSLEKKLIQRTAALEAVIQQANAVQLQYLSWQLNVTLEEELQNRAKLEEDHMDETTGPSNAVTLEQLEEQIQPTQILAESEIMLNEWIQNVIREEVESFHAETATTTKKCAVTPVDAAQLVQSALTTHMHDGIVDHAQEAQIVHEFTSETYIPPAKPNQRLGNVWWRKYIPQDWERVLPSGWEDWRVGVPLFVAHSLGWKAAEVLPPEAMLTPLTYPGSCWPMKGSKGQVTIRLPYPVKVNAITIAHTSSSLADVSSAPKRIRFIAYPPCSDCQGMGFDVNDAWELTSVEYDLEGRSSQTFDIPVGAGSCSEEAPSCTVEPEPLGKLHVASPQDEAVAGITVAILDNWGMEDYTCLYRFRVHGDVAES